MKINIVFAVNEEYANPCRVAIKSILENKNRDTILCIFVLHSDLSHETQANIRKMAQDDCEISMVDVKSMICENMYEKSYFTKEMYYRLIVSDILDIDKFIYLDADVVVLRDLQELYNIEFEDNYLIGVQDEKNGEHLETNHNVYINSGVMVVNAIKFRADGIWDKCRNYLQRNKDLHFPDQDTVNHICRDKIKCIDSRWNVLIRGFEYDGLKDAYIVHYCGEYKPWKNGAGVAFAYYYEYAHKIGIDTWKVPVENRKKSIKEKICNPYWCYIGKMPCKFHFMDKNRVLQKLVRGYRLITLPLRNPRAYSKNEIRFQYIEMTLTTKCTLKCKHCANLMEYYSNHEIYDFENIKKDLKKFLKSVDMVEKFGLIGGEPFLSPYIAEIVKILVASRKVICVLITTNGTIYPKEEVRKVLRHPKVKVVVSDYGEKSTKMDMWKKDNLINREILPTVDLWGDFGNVTKRQCEVQELKNQYICCGSICYTLLKGKIFRCPIAAHGYNLGKIPLIKGQYVEIKKENDPKVIRQKIKRLKETEYIEACRYCNKGTVNFKEVPAAEQIRGKENANCNFT